MAGWDRRIGERKVRSRRVTNDGGGADQSTRRQARPRRVLTCGAGAFREPSPLLALIYRDLVANANGILVGLHFTFFIFIQKRVMCVISCCLGYVQVQLIQMTNIIKYLSRVGYEKFETLCQI